MLNKVTADHAYLHLYKSDERAVFENKADLLVKKVTCTNKDLLLFQKDTSNSAENKSFSEEFFVIPEQFKTLELN